MLAREQPRPCRAPGRDRLADRAVLEVVLRVQLVELRPRAPDPLADERAPRALREPLDVAASRQPVDHVVEGVVRLHPLDEERRLVPPPCGRPGRAARASAPRTRCSAASSAARSAAVIRGVATSVASASSSARTRTPRAARAARSSGRGRRDSARTRRARARPAGAAPRGRACGETRTAPRAAPGAAPCRAAIAPPTISSSSTRAMSSALVVSSGSTATVSPLCIQK